MGFQQRQPPAGLVPEGQPEQDLSLDTHTNSQPLLWNDRAVVALAAAALVLTVGIIAFQMIERQGLLDVSMVRIFYRLFLFDDYPAAFLHLVLLLLALIKPIQRSATALTVMVAHHRHVVAGLACAAFAVGSLVWYQAHPLAMDEYVPVLQSHVFLAGRLLGEFPPEIVDWLIFPSFQGHFLYVSHVTGQFGSAYWPGFALLLVPFSAIGASWLCNPVLAAAALLVIHRLTLLLTDDHVAAGTAILVALASPAFIVNAISYYSMTAHLLCNAAFALLLLQPTARGAALAGLIGGLALTLHNPLPHMLFAAPWAAWLLWRTDRWRTIPALLGGYLPFVVVVGFGWNGLVAGLSESAGLASAASQGPLSEAVNKLNSVLTWPSAALLHARLIGLMKLWIWAAPAVVVVAAVGFWKRRHDVHFRLLAASAGLTLLGYLFVPADQGHGWGFRYFHSAWLVLPVFAAAALSSRPEEHASLARNTAGRTLAPYVHATSLLSLVVLVPYFGFQVQSFITAHLAQEPTAEAGEPRLVIISPVMQYYAQDLAQNDPFLREPVIRMVTRGRAEDERMIERNFPDLVLLSKSYKGTVWGRPAHPVDGSDSASVGVAAQQERQ
jgi:hypothetical protein